MDDRGERSGRRFAILRHELPQNATRPSHWDLMLEHRGILLTWELPTLAFANLPATFDQLSIRRLADHRIAYLTYEGPVSNDRGSVKQVDSGEYEITELGSAEWLEVVATGRLVRFKLRLRKSCFNDVFSHLRQARTGDEFDLADAAAPFSAADEVIEFVRWGEFEEGPTRK